ncbi:MAG: ATP-binding protein [Rickettsiales bacterium]
MNNKNKIKKPRPRILVVMEPHPEIARVFRAAKRKAQLNDLDWEVLVIETPTMHRRLSKADQELLLNSATLAEQMGAIVTKNHAKSMLDGIWEVLSQRCEESISIFSIKLADINKDFHWLRFRKSLAEKVKRKYGNDFRVATVPIGVEASTRRKIANLLHINAKEVFVSLFAVAVATGVIYLADYMAPEVIGKHNRNKSLIYMIACAFAAGRYGLVAGILAAVTSFFALNMLFMAPYHQLTIDDRTDALNLALFLLIGIIISLMGSHDYGSRLSLMKRADRFHSLFKIHRLALNKNSQEEAIKALDQELRSLLGTDTAFFLPSIMDDNQLETLYRDNVELNDQEKKALDICWQESKTTGVGAPYCPMGCHWRFEPMVTAQGEMGVLGIRISSNIQLDSDFGRLLSGLSDQVALILERLELGQIAEDTKIQAEREKLRAMLLSSVSHDLKTPLASIIGSLSVYRSMEATLPSDLRLTLINTALDEAQRLDSFITNILDMTRIESGQVELKEEWIDPADIVSDIRKRLRERLRNHKLVIEPPSDSIEVAMDALMTGQVIQNLLDNAAKYTKEGTKICVSWEAKDNAFKLHVRDYGNGIPEDKLGTVFDKYARINKQDHQVAGTGLGLAIAKAVMETQDGSISASNHPEGGAIFTITLPKTRKKGESKVA